MRHKICNSSSQNLWKITCSSISIHPPEGSCNNLLCMLLLVSFFALRIIMTKERHISLLLIMLLSSILHGVSATVRRDDHSMRFELIHRRSLDPTRKAPYERFRSRRRLQGSDDMGLPLSSATDLGVSEYVVSLKVGTPVQNFYLIADTGRSLTWIKCRLHKRDKKTLPLEHYGDSDKPRDFPARRFFKAYRSSTFRTIPCSSQMCRRDLKRLFSIPRCPAAKDPCAFDHGYISGDTTFGFFANETVSIGHRFGGKKLNNTVIGCSLTYRGLDGADGVLGLGQNPYSFAMQVANEFGAKFSYCLVDHLSPKNITAYLLFGENKELGRDVQHTELLDVDEMYGVNVKGVSLGGQMLDIPSSTWNYDMEGGVMVDSGSSTTFLTLPAYGPITDAIKDHLSSKYQQVDLPPEAPNMDFCFNTTSFDESDVPRLTWHMADGAEFNPDVNGYIVEMGGPLEGIRCIGFQPVEWPAQCIIGNILQQNHIWEYDLVNKKLSFAPSKCNNY